MSSTGHKTAERLSIFSANCLNRLSPLMHCSVCTDVCPLHSLSFQDEKWETSSCTLCGICAAVCPTQVFQIDLISLLNTDRQNPLSLCCTKNTSAPEGTVRINCFQQFTPLNILQLLYYHPKVTIYLEPEFCETCSQKWYPKGLTQQLKPFHLPDDMFQIITNPPKTNSDESNRRNFFHDLLHRTEMKSKEKAIELADNFTSVFSSEEQAEEEPAIFPSRLPFYAALLKNQIPTHKTEELPFQSLSCSLCNFCGACTHLCPTDALLLKKETDEAFLLFHPELCIGCDLCTQVCMQHGLSWDSFLTEAEFLETPLRLAHSHEKICTRCEQPYFLWPESDENLCAFCK